MLSWGQNQQLSFGLISMPEAIRWQAEQHEEVPALPKGSSVLPRLLQDPARLSSALDIATYKGILVQKRARYCCSDQPLPAGRAGPPPYMLGHNKVASHVALCRLSLP